MFKALTLSASVAVGIAGCASVDQAPSTSPEPASSPANQDSTPRPAAVATPGLSAQNRFRLILDLLEKGDAHQAQAELEAYLVDRPNSRIAKGLVAQLEAPPGTLFPAESFPVTLASGESLSTLARDYLGDLYLFYALARYNNIAVPRDIKIGQTINIPATTSALAHRDALATGSVTESVAESVDGSVDHQESPAQLDPDNAELPPEVAAEVDAQVTPATPTEFEPAPPVEPLDPVAMLVTAFNAAATGGDYTDVVAITTDHAAAIEAADWDLLKDAFTSSGDALAATNPEQAAQQYTAAAELLTQRNQHTNALALLDKAVQLDAANTTAAELQSSVTTSLIDSYHREASAAFRAQQLETAIALWDKVLALDPEHSNALVYRAQALELQDRLSNLKD